MSRPPRLRDFDYRGKYAYSVTFCTFNRRRTLVGPPLADAVLDRFLHTGHHHGFAFLAYCLMPDHVHLLVKGERTTADLRRFVKNAKQSTGQAYSHTANRPLWQQGYYDHVVRPEENLFQIARYIIDNPVRAGVVRHASQYRYVGSDTWPLADLTDMKREQRQG